MISSSGHMAAAGLDRDDNSHRMIKPYSGNFTFDINTFVSTADLGTYGGAGSLTIGTPSESRYVLLIGYIIDYAGANNSVNTVTINGGAVDNLTKVAVNSVNSGTETLMAFACTKRVPTGTTATVEVTLTNSGTGLDHYTHCTFDHGAISPTFTIGQDTTPGTGGILDFGDIGNCWGALVNCSWEDSAQTQSNVDWDASRISAWSSSTTYAVNDVVKDPTDDQFYICIAANTNQQPDLDTTEIYWKKHSSEGDASGNIWAFGQAMIYPGERTDECSISATPDTFTAGDAGIGIYIKADY